MTLKFELGIFKIADSVCFSINKVSSLSESCNNFVLVVISLKKVSIVQRKRLQEDDKLVTAKECPICYEAINDTTTAQLNCGHMFCISCILNTILKTYDARKNDVNCNCPLCRNPISVMSGEKERMIVQLNTIVDIAKINPDVYDCIG